MRLMPHPLRGTTSKSISELFIKSNYTQTMINYDQAKYCVEYISKIENFKRVVIDHSFFLKLLDGSHLVSL